MALEKDQRERLLKIARTAIEAKLEDRAEPESGSAEADLGRDQGAFVTLHLAGHLRGCIGNFTGEGPLAGTIREMARAAAFNDPRFPPLKSTSELARCDIEISALSPLVETDPEEIQVGLHGIYIIKGYNRGVLLPQVATEYGWDRETFLDQTCVKAGLRPGEWREPGTRIMTFTAEVFGEKE